MLPNVGLIGSAGAGKGALADLLIEKANYERQSLAHGVKLGVGKLLWNYAEDCDPDDETVIDWVNANKGVLRGLLQQYGVFMRVNRGADYWIAQVLERVKDSNRHWAIPCVTDDVRFPNEAEALHKAGFLLIRIDRPDDHRLEHGSPQLTAEQKAHSSEAQIDDLPVDFTIRNSGSPELLLARFFLALGLYFTPKDEEGYIYGRATIAAGVIPCR